MMNKVFVPFFFALAFAAPAQHSFPTLVPMPLDVSPAPKTNLLSIAAVSITVDSGGQSANSAADFLADAVRKSGLAVNPQNFAGRVVPIRFMGGEKALGGEGYRLEVGEKEIQIVAPSGAGHFYGAQTLLQLFTPDILVSTEKVARAELPFVTIRDQPRFRWRGAMLDISRHFFGMDILEHFVDLLAMNKMNVLHLHLTDDTGWRLESASYTNLNGVGATGNYSDSNAPPALLTTNDVRELVAYAQKRFVTIVPEIDMPGHASAAARAYPALDGGNGTFNPSPYGSTNAYAFITNILAEVMREFPSSVIHVGGDEVDNNVWNKLDQVQRMKIENRLETTKAVEHFFDLRIANFITKSGRRPAGWDEIASAGVTNRAVIFWWRHDKTNVRDDALAAGHEMVMCPRDPCYFDYRQIADGPGETGWKITNTAENVYNWEPVPPDIAKYSGQILGVQANLWTEHIETVEKLERLTLPRLGALAEVAWSQPSRRYWPRFTNDLPVYQARLTAMGFTTEQIGPPVSTNSSIHTASTQTTAP